MVPLAITHGVSRMNGAVKRRREALAIVATRLARGAPFHAKTGSMIGLSPHPCRAPIRIAIVTYFAMLAAFASSPPPGTGVRRTESSARCHGWRVTSFSASTRSPRRSAPASSRAHRAVQASQRLVQAHGVPESQCLAMPSGPDFRASSEVARRRRRQVALQGRRRRAEPR